MSATRVPDSTTASALVDRPFKAGVVEGRVVALRDVEAIAALPPKEELISKIMFLINCQAQRLVTVLSAVPRNLAVVIKQIGEQKGGEEAAS